MYTSEQKIKVPANIDFVLERNNESYQHSSNNLSDKFKSNQC